MSFLLVAIPFISALSGWLLALLAIKLLFHPRLPFRVFGVTVQGLVQKRRQEFSITAANLLGNELSSLQEKLEQKVLDPGNLKKIMPEIEGHIDHFLRVKLQEAIPMVAMFVGDKTISQLKEVFMTEMQTLFPVIMESYVKELQKDFDIPHLIADKLESLPLHQIESFFLKTFRRELRYVARAGAIAGFIIGTFQVILIFFISR